MILPLAPHETDFNHCNGGHRCFVKGKFYNRTFRRKIVFFFIPCVTRKSHKKKNQVTWWMVQDNCHLMKEKMGVGKSFSREEVGHPASLICFKVVSCLKVPKIKEDAV